MSEENTKPPPAPPAPPAANRSPVIRLDLGNEDFGQRMLSRQVPAWVISLGLHGILFALVGVAYLFGAFRGMEPPKAAASENQELQTKLEETEQQKNFENPDIGLDPNLPTNYNIDRIEDISVAGPLKPDEKVGNDQGDGPPQTLPPPPGLGDTSAGQGGGLDIAAANGTGLA